MLYQIYLVYEDGRRDLAEEISRLDEAMTFALRLADDIGRQHAGKGHGPSKAVEIYSSSTLLVISIRIIRGGLLASKGDPRSRST